MGFGKPTLRLTYGRTPSEGNLAVGDTKENLGLVSIVMPLYNYGRYLSGAVESVLSQTYPFWELLIVDDCSTDDSFLIAMRLEKKDERIRVFQLPENGGSSAARNKALDEAKGEFVAFLDSDDRYDPEYLESQVKLLVEKGCDIVVSSYRRKTENGSTVFHVPDVITYDSIMKGNPMAPLGTLYRFSKFRNQRFPTEDREREDFVFFAQLLKAGAVAEPNSDVLGELTIHSGSKSKNKLRMVRYQYRAYKFLGIPFFLRWYYLFRWAIYGIRKYWNVR